MTGPWINHFDAETNRLNPNRAIFWEPLQTTAPQNAEPYCCLLNTVIFYKPGKRGLEQYDEVKTEWDLLGWRFSDKLDGFAGVAALVWFDHDWWELINGEVTWDDWCGWQMKREARRLRDDDWRWQYLEPPECI